MKLIFSSNKIHRIFFIVILLSSGCKKETPLTPSGDDKNIYKNKDNPDDPIDHAMYLFYKETGVANYYSDTIAIQKISKEGEIPEKFRYIKIGLNYASAGFSGFTSTPISNKQIIPGILELLKTEVLPKIPAGNYISCLLFLDDIVQPWKFVKVQLSHGMSAVIGFNTVGVVAKNTTLLSDDERKMYAASILAGLTINKIRAAEEEYLSTKFFTISRQLGKNVLSVDVYSASPLFSGAPDPNSLALLYLPISNNFLFESPGLPTEDSDLRSFLTMVFRYNEDSFNEIYGSFPSIMQKYKAVRDLLIRKGYQTAN